MLIWVQLEMVRKWILYHIQTHIRLFHSLFVNILVFRAPQPQLPFLNVDLGRTCPGALTSASTPQYWAE